MLERAPYSEIYCPTVHRELTDNSDENVSSIFRVKDYAKQETLTFNTLYGITSQRMGLFITTAVKTSNLILHSLRIL
jgi:hypothetical protein